MAHRNLIIAALVAGAVFAWTKPASAQSFLIEGADARVNLPATLFGPARPDSLVPPAAPVADPAAPGEFRQVQTQTSSVLTASLVGLYASTVALQMLDVKSTYAVIARGGAEGNPVMAPVVANKSAFVALKVGLAASTILAARELAKHNKVAAVVTMVALNSVYASVVAHNFSLANQMR
jgi:Domain of unknown function (DUF5658)